MIKYIRISILLLFISQSLHGQIHKIYSDKPKLYSIFGNSVYIEGDYLISTSKEPFYSPYRQRYLRAFLFKFENNKWVQKDTLAGAIYNGTFNDLGLSYMSFSGKTAFTRKLISRDSISTMKVMIYDISNDKFELIDSITHAKKLRGSIALFSSSKNWLFIRTQASPNPTMIDYFYKRIDNKWVFSDSIEYKDTYCHAGLFRTQMNDNFLITSYREKAGNKPHVLIYKNTGGQWNTFSDIQDAGGSSLAFTDDLKFIAVAWGDTIRVYKHEGGEYKLNQKLYAETYLKTTIFAPTIVISNGYLYSGYYDYVYHGNHGEVFQYFLDNDQWKLRRKIKPAYPDSTYMHYGESLDIWEDRLAVGADYDYTFNPNRGAVYIYDTPARTNLIDTICQGDEYIFNDSLLQSSGIYTDTLLTYYNLDSIVTLDLTVIPQSQVIIDTVICEGDSIVLGDSVITESGYYEIYYDQIYNCQSYVKAKIQFDTLEVLDSIFPDFGCNSGEILLDINGNNPPFDLSWNNGDKTKDLKSLEDGIYKITIYTNSGCQYKYEYEVPAKYPRFIVPNAFFPEGNEELNKTFRIYLSDTTNVKILSTEIFDRWGEKVFSSSGNVFWDGTYRNRKTPPEVFLYKIVVDSPCGMEIKKGQVSLLK